MKIYIDVNHPAHVHYFKNLIKNMSLSNHIFIISNRNDKMINQLLDIYGIDHIIRNKRPNKKSAISSMLYLLGMVLSIIRNSIKYKPDLYLGFGSSPCAIASFFMRKPCIILDDTEHNIMNHKLYKPFADSILTPYYFHVNMGNNQISYKAYVEQLYLHSSIFTCNDDVLNELNIKAKQYVLVRFIAYDARHDSAVNPLALDDKKKIVNELEKKYQVIVSLEKSITDPFFDPYIYKFSPDKMHTIIKNAVCVITEGATMASEAFILGVPFIYINPLKVGNVDDQIKYMPEIAYSETELNSILKIINSLKPFNNNLIVNKVEKRTINPTKFLTWFIQNYPESHKIMKDNPDYQNKFK